MTTLLTTCLGEVVNAKKSFQSIRCESFTPSVTVKDETMFKKLIGQLQQASIESILDTLSDGIFIVDKELLITFFNRAAEEITGIPRNQAIGQRCAKIFRSNLCGKDCVMQKALATKTSIFNKYASIINFEGRYVPIHLSIKLLHDQNNEVIGGVEIFQDLRLVQQQSRKLASQFQFDELITRNHTMGKFINILPKIAASDKNVLITGEVGTGKEIMARAIHIYSGRKENPFIVLSCSALSGSFFSTKIFGNKSIEFPASYKEESGCLAFATGSTLFLDEISEIKKVLQQQLLGIIEGKKDKSNGTTNSLNASVRVIASTDKNLPALIKKGKFSRDLYFQLNGVRLELPPLRKRKEDIPLLVEHFITCFNRIQSKSVAGVSQDTMAMLMGYNYPGNISELKNIIEHAFVLCPGDLISPAYLPEELRKESNVKLESFGIEMAVQAVEAKTIIAALKRNNYNRTAAARDLGIHKSTFFRKIKNLGIVLPHIDGRFRSTHIHEHTL